MQYPYSIGLEHRCRTFWKLLHTWKHPKYAWIETKSMGKVHPNHWAKDQRTLRTNLVRSEDKSTWYTWFVRTQTCVKVVIFTGRLSSKLWMLWWQQQKKLVQSGGAPRAVTNCIIAIVAGCLLLPALCWCSCHWLAVAYCCLHWAMAANCCLS